MFIQVPPHGCLIILLTLDQYRFLYDCFFNLKNFSGSKNTEVTIQEEYDLIEHSENKIVTYHENEVGPRVLQSSILQKCVLQGFQITYTELMYIQ